MNLLAGSFLALVSIYPTEHWFPAHPQTPTPTYFGLQNAAQCTVQTGEQAGASTLHRPTVASRAAVLVLLLLLPPATTGKPWGRKQKEGGEACTVSLFVTHGPGLTMTVVPVT